MTSQVYLTDAFLGSQRIRLQLFLNAHDSGDQQLSRQDRARAAFAIKRIDEGQYGLCCHCGWLIEKALLEVMPESLLCSACMQENADA